METNKELGQRIQLVNCAKSTPAARIPRWISIIRHSFLLTIGNVNVGTIDDIHKEIKLARTRHVSSITCRFGIMKKTAMHPQTGVPIVFHDQLNVISEHLRTIKVSVEQNSEKHKRYLNTITPKVHAINSTKK